MNIKKYTLVESTKNLKVEIEFESEELGYNIYVYKIDSGECILDYMQDSLELSKEFISKELNLTNDQWLVE